MPFVFNPITGKLDLLNSGTVQNVTATSPLFSSGGATPNITVQQASASQSGVLSPTDWSTFNNKQDKSSSNYITNPDAEIDVSGWNLYNDSGNTVPAYLINQDLTFTSALSGSGGNGVEIEYIYNASFPSSTPNINVISSSHVQVQWNNGPTIANNPTATQLKAAWDAVGAATAIATVAITGTASKRQYITGASFLANGGDTAPVNGTGGSISGVTFTQNTSTPLIGTASFDLGKDAANRQGQGVSTDFVINSIDKDKTLQIEFIYQGSSGMVLGSSSDVKVFMYDIDNATLIPVTPLIYLAGPVSTPKQFTGLFNTTTSSNYRLILHISTTSTTSWDLLLDSVVVTDELSPVTATQVPSLVLLAQPISGAVTDHMCVMWRDGATQWVPATIAGAALPVFGDDKTQLGFATNIVGSLADIYIRGAMDGFSFGPFVGFEQYIDNVAGGISPLPSPFTDLYVMVGMAISSTILNIQFDTHVDLIANSSGTPLKGGLLTSSAINDGTGDLVLSVGGNGNVLVANSAASLGINWAPAVVATSPLVYTTSTRALTLSTVPIASGGTGLTTTSQSFAFIGPSGGSGAPTWRLLVASDIPTLNQNTTGSAAKWTTARSLAGNSVDGSANVAFANKFIVQGTTDAGLSAAQFLGALGTGLVKNTTTTGVLSIAAASDVTGAALTGFVSGAGTVSATDTILQGFDKIVGNIAALNSTSIANSSVVTGTTVTDALNTLSNNFTEVYLNAIINGGSVTANTEIASWTTVNKDTNSAFNSSTGTFTVPVAGDYEVSFHADTTALTPTAQIYHNGVLIQTGINSLTRTFVTTTIANCSVNDTIWVALDTTSTLVSTNTDNILNISKIVGPGIGPVNARYHSSSTSITSSLATITYTTKDFDTQASAYSAGVYTIPSAGKYMVKASLSLTAATAAAGNNYDIIIRKNSTEIARFKYVVGAATQKPNTVVVEDLVSCAANDTIDIQASAAGTTPSINASTTLNYFYINKVSI